MSPVRAWKLVALVLPVLLIAGCDTFLPDHAGFREVRYYATGELEWGTTEYSILFCPGGNVDVALSDYGVYGTYQVERKRVVLRTPVHRTSYTLLRMEKV
jgi:hypothetical protein